MEQTSLDSLGWNMNARGPAGPNLRARIPFRKEKRGEKPVRGHEKGKTKVLKESKTPSKEVEVERLKQAFGILSIRSKRERTKYHTARKEKDKATTDHVLTK